MKEQQTSNFLIVLCLILAALLGSARSQDVSLPAIAAAPGEAPAAAPMSMAAVMAPAAAPAQAPAAATSPAEAPTAADAPAAAPSMSPALAPAVQSVTATTGYASRRNGPPPSKALKDLPTMQTTLPSLLFLCFLRRAVPIADRAHLWQAPAAPGSFSFASC